MTDITFTEAELGLIKRVLAFAVFDVPITDALGDKIYPTTETRAAAQDLENRLEEAGVATPGKLFTSYDPFVMKDKITTVRYFADNGVEYNVRGRVVEVTEDGGRYFVTFADGGEFDFESRDDLQKNSRVELEQE